MESRSPKRTEPGPVLLPKFWLLAREVAASHAVYEACTPFAHLRNLFVPRRYRPETSVDLAMQVITRPNTGTSGYEMDLQELREKYDRVPDEENATATMQHAWTLVSVVVVVVDIVIVQVKCGLDAFLVRCVCFACGLSLLGGACVLCFVTMPRVVVSSSPPLHVPMCCRLDLSGFPSRSLCDDEFTIFDAREHSGCLWSR